MFHGWMDGSEGRSVLGWNSDESRSIWGARGDSRIGGGDRRVILLYLSVQEDEACMHLVLGKFAGTVAQS